MIIPEILDEIEANITELTSDDIFPTNAPEKYSKPYLVYAITSYSPIKTLNGIIDNEELGIMFSIMAEKYKDMVLLRKKIIDLLKGFPHKKIGTDKDILVQDITINNITETWENSLNLNRGIIDFTINY